MNPFLLAGALFAAIGLLQMAQDEHEKQNKGKTKAIPKPEKSGGGSGPVTVNVTPSVVKSETGTKPKAKPKAKPTGEVPSNKPTDG